MKHKFFLASLMLLFCTFLSAETYNGTCGAQGDNITWTLDTETGILTISGTGAMTDYWIYNGNVNTPWYYYRTSIKTLIIENGVTSIGNEAFYGCSSLTSVTIPNSVTSIGEYAFDGYSGLKAVHISDLAAWCKISFGLDNANPLHYAHNLYLNGKLVTDLTIPNSVTSIGNRAFDGCSGLTSVTIPNSVTSIGEDAFEDCSSLTSVTIPNSVTSIGRYAFSRCSSLTSVAIPNSVTSIGSSAFYGCCSLTSVTIPNSVTSIGNGAFYNVLNITYNGTATGSPWGAKCVNGYVDGYFVYSDATKTNLLGCSNAKGDITIPNSVTSIGDHAFDGCSSLTSVTIPNSVTSIGNGAFRDVLNIVYNGTVTGSPWGAKCVNGFVDGYLVYSDASKTNLIGCSTAIEGEVTIPNSVTSIPDYAFCRCSGLTSITIPNSVTSIGLRAFQNSSLNAVYITDLAAWCKISFAPENANPLQYAHNLYLNGKLVTDLTIPNSVTSIGNRAFDGCSGLTSVTIPNSVTSIGGDAFSGCSGLKAVHISDLAAWCKISFGGEYTLTSNPLYYAHNLYLDGELVTDLVIPGNITSIGKSAFYGCSSLTSVTIPNSVTSIGNFAFSGCSSLTSVTIPNSVTSIGGGAFYNVLNIVYSGSATGSPWGAKNVNGFVDGYFVYSDATKTNLQRCSSSIKGDLVIPNGVKSIGNSAFSGCSGLNSVTIPNSVTSIGNRAFDGCSGLTSVTIPNSVTSIGGYAFSGCAGLTSVTIPNSVTSLGDDAFSGCSGLKYIISLPNTPPMIKSYTFPIGVTIYVNNDALDSYQNATNWKSYNIKGLIDSKNTEAPTSAVISMTNNAWSLNGSYIVSCGIEGGEMFSGNTLEYIGLEPNREYTDVPIVLTSNTSENITVNLSFTTSALTLTTQPSKPVSSNTAILLAETNMADIETSCGFEWKRNDAPADMPATQVLCPVANGLMAGRLKGLKDDVYYKYRAFYKSAAGNMYYGDWQYIFTGDVTVEFDPILYTYAAQFVTERTATVKGYALAGSEDFTEQGFEYWADSRTANAPARRAPHYEIGEKHTVKANGISMCVTLNDLDEGTTYKYRTYAKVGSKTLYGTEMTFTTQGAYKEPVVTGIENIDDADGDVRAPSATKVFENGQLYILLPDGTHYNLQGLEVE